MPPGTPSAGWVSPRDDQPYQRLVNRGYITRRAIAYTTPYGKSAASWQLRITPAGLRKLHSDLTAERLPALPTHRG
ncbi:phage antirepressor KilAC domain-containing protein [Phytomonospora sp. NPDC050363]|uniref:phage antirepressor KilAC domain-containing protein n=1 Tax=Phytomonospora sp. NPDC050363 TaxID=3155642 RepID=UPI0033D17876